MAFHFQVYGAQCGKDVSFKSDYSSTAIDFSILSLLQILRNSSMVRTLHSPPVSIFIEVLVGLEL